MTLIRWNPWNLQTALEDDWEMPTVPGLSRLLGQGMNIYETDKAIVAEIALPGISEDHIDVSVDDKVVRISASSEATQEDKSGRKYFMSSMAQSYNYSFRLPEGLEAETEPEAMLAHGVLTLTFKKAAPVAPKKIKVVTKGSSAPKKVETSPEKSD
jgi:HSP20 family molecular chaperone IbpA